VSLGYTPRMGSSPGSRSPRPVPAYFCSLEVENVRCFAHAQRLELMHDGQPAKWTVLLGDNGVGKTTLLQCLYMMAPFVEEVKPWVLAGTHPRFSEGWRFTRTGCAGATLTAEILANDKDRLRLRVEVDGPERTMTQYAHYDVLCLCCGYGATRRIGSNGLESRSLLDAASSLFSSDATLINAVEWLLQADYAARGTAADSRAARHRDAIKSALIGLLPDVEDIRVAGLEEIPPRPRIDVKTPYGVVSLRELSVGYQTMVAWVVDLASRMFEAYPDSDNPLAEAAVVLVDEIDLHLHPRWQREITSYLDDLFPHVQFIVTAHSPLVVQAPGVTNVAVLRRNGDHVEILNDPEEVRGWRVDQILTSDLFGLESARPAVVERLIDRQQELVLLDDLTDAQRAELREIEAKLAKLAPGETARDREAWALIHEMASKLHEGSRGQA
jgi:hypothetical protein